MVQVACNFLQLRCNLYSRSTVSNSRNPLAVWIELWIPVGRVTDMSFVLVDTYASSWLVKTHRGSKSRFVAYPDSQATSTR
jgi:hypothetical protein